MTTGRLKAILTGYRRRRRRRQDIEDAELAEYSRLVSAIRPTADDRLGG